MLDLEMLHTAKLSLQRGLMQVGVAPLPWHQMLL